jgi:hypothetical protein
MELHDLNTCHQTPPPNTVALETKFLAHAVWGHIQTIVNTLVIKLCDNGNGLHYFGGVPYL